MKLVPAETLLGDFDMTCDEALTRLEIAERHGLPHPALDGNPADEETEEYLKDALEQVR